MGWRRNTARFCVHAPRSSISPSPPESSSSSTGSLSAPRSRSAGSNAASANRRSGGSSTRSTLSLASARRGILTPRITYSRKPTCRRALVRRPLRRQAPRPALLHPPPPDLLRLRARRTGGRRTPTPAARPRLQPTPAQAHPTLCPAGVLAA